MLHKNRDTLSLRDEICTCPTIAIVESSQFIFRPFHIKEDKSFISKQVKRLVHFLRFLRFH